MGDRTRAERAARGFELGDPRTGRRGDRRFPCRAAQLVPHRPAAIPARRRPARAAAPRPPRDCRRPRRSLTPAAPLNGAPSRRRGPARDPPPPPGPARTPPSRPGTPPPLAARPACPLSVYIGADGLVGYLLPACRSEPARPGCAPGGLDCVTGCAGAASIARLRSQPGAACRPWTAVRVVPVTLVAAEDTAMRSAALRMGTSASFAGLQHIRPRTNRTSAG